MRMPFCGMALHLDVSVMNEHWTCVKEEGINSPQHNSPIYRKGQPRYVSRDPSAIRVGSDVFDYFELLELNIYMRHIYSKKVGCTRCHQFLLAVIFFAMPPDFISKKKPACTCTYY